MTQIGYIMPDKRLAAYTKKIFEEYNMDVEIGIGAFEEGVKEARKLIQNGAKIIISRGGTSIDIKQSLNVPVIDIKITVYDIVKAIKEASKLGNKIAVVGFYNLLEGLEALNPLLSFDLKQIYIESEDEAFEKIEKAKHEGIDVIIGGVIQSKVAKDLGIKSVFLESGHQAIINAYKEAEIVLETLLKERRKAEEVYNVLDLARDGFLAIDKSGKITLINNEAAKLMKCDVNTSIGKYIRDISPKLRNLEVVLETGKEYLNDITNLDSTTIVYNRRPIKVDDEVLGVVATLQDINILQESEFKIRKKIYTKGLYAKYNFSDINGISKELKKTIEIAMKFAYMDSTLLITGESGTGKELFSQSIHNVSLRRNGPFVAVNCASLPNNILESELFGYIEGAFTGARKEGKIGLFELAHKGTIFLDEIGEIPLNLQGRLLRVLEERVIMRLGDDRVIPIDVRVIAATNKDLVALVNDKCFREDLYYRINVLRLQIPPLRKRKEDIPILIDKLLERYKISNEHISLSKAAINMLENYSWPGNVRELRNLMERIVILKGTLNTDYEIITDFIEENRNLLKNHDTNDSITAERIEQVLQSVDNNKTRAAEILGIHRSTLWRILKNE